MLSHATSIYIHCRITCRPGHIRRLASFNPPSCLLHAGLTDRPSVPKHATLNPYTVRAQAQLTLDMCAALGLRRVVLVGHADGCLVALLAAAMAGQASSHVAIPINVDAASADLAWMASYAEVGLPPTSS